MRFLLGILAALALTTVGISQAQMKSVDVSVHLDAGVEKGFTDSSKTVDGQRWFYAGKTVVLKLPEPGLAKWKQYDLGPAFKLKPSFYCDNGEGKPGIVYRFKDGVLVRHSNQAFYMSWPMAKAWWPRSGVKEKPWPPPAKKKSQA